MIENMNSNNDRLSLEEQENDAWGAAPADATPLVRRVYWLRTRPVDSYQPEDLRVLLSQQVGVRVLMPRVLTYLRQEPLLEGDFYPGDILVAVLRMAPEYWRDNPTQRTALEEIVAAVDNESLAAEIEAFRKANPAPEQAGHFHVGPVESTQPSAGLPSSKQPFSNKGHTH